MDRATGGCGRHGGEITMTKLIAVKRKSIKLRFETINGKIIFFRAIKTSLS